MVNRCKKCFKGLRKENKSGYCSLCYGRLNYHNYVDKKEYLENLRKIREIRNG
jgi:hypothetical protein